MDICDVRYVSPRLEREDTPVDAFEDLIRRVRDDEPAAIIQLYGWVAPSVRPALRWRLMNPGDVDDAVHDVFLATVRAIRRGKIQHPERFLVYVRSIARRAATHCLKNRQRFATPAGEHAELTSCVPSPEEVAGYQQQLALVHRALTSRPAREREILTRFYLNGEDPETICRHMQLTQTQYRLLKWRAKAALVERCGRLLTTLPVRRPHPS